ncbi:hypothetical protein [Streptomyces sp. NPDC101150]|uniref:hypothetical protein n=1 Tax=Streptomyces sp. NPDC101150 TaxID=3366114 RepID=UPI00380B4B86
MLTGPEREERAAAVMAELESALKAVGITLPSLGLDPVALPSVYMGPLIELGRCNLDTAGRLADVLTEYAEAAVPGHEPGERRA